MEGVRFFVVAVLGLTLDLAVSWAMAVWVGLPLAGAAVTGFCTASIFNYLLHELWTFQSGSRKVSAFRSVKYAAILALTLTTRVTIVASLDALLIDSTPLLLLAIATAGSFLVNYSASKLFVFH